MMSAVRRWLGRLEERERRVIANRYGIGGGSQQTLTQIGQQLGISKERVRQIETAHVPSYGSGPDSRESSRWRSDAL